MAPRNAPQLLRWLTVAACLVWATGAAAREAVCDVPPVPCCALKAPAAAVPDEDSSRNALAIGVQIWPEHLRDGPEEQLLALGPAVFRHSAGPGRWKQADPLPATADMAEVRRYVARHVEARREALETQSERLRALLSRTQGKLHLILWEPPFTDAELRLRRRPDAPRTMPRSAVPVMAKFYVALVEVLREYDFPVDAIELANEPNGDWNIHIAPATYVELIREVRREAARAGVTLPPIAGPGTSTYAALLNYLNDPALGPQLLDAVDIVSVHAWDDRVNRNMREIARETRRRLAEMGHHGQVAVTEFAPTFLDKDDRQAERGANRRSPQARSYTDRYAAEVLRTKAVMLSLDMSPVIFWEYRDVAWGGGSYGLVDLDGRERPTYGAFAQLAAIIAGTRPAAVLAGADDRTFVFFGREGAAFILLVNPTGEPERFAFSDDVLRLFGEAWLRANPAPCGARAELLLAPYEFRFLKSG